MKKLLASILSIIIILPISSIVSAANGDVAGYIYSTDILACKNTGISSGSIYYWFKDKDEVFLDAAEYGLSKVTDEVFNFAFKNINNIEALLEAFPAKLMEYKRELRFIFQLATSTQYGDKMRLMADKLDFIYDAYAMKLSEKLDCEYEKLQPFIYLFVSASLDYITWEDKYKMEKQLKALQNVMMSLKYINQE